jgi:hypothetical protein
MNLIEPLKNVSGTKFLINICGAFLVSVIASTSLLAQEISVGVGLDDILDSNRRDLDGGVLATSAIAVSGRVKFYGNLKKDYVLLMPTINFQIDSKKDFFAGAGLTAKFPFLKSTPFFLETGLTAGLLTESSTMSKIDNDFKFQSYVGLGYQLDERTGVILSIDHMLDKDFKNYNPGSETILLNYYMNLD